MTFPASSAIAPFLYALPLALLFGVMLIAVVRLFAMRGRAEVLVQPSWLSALAEAQRRMGFKHGTALLVSEELRSPISWGVLRPTIVLSPQAVEAVGEAEAIIAHELAHVARLDWAKLLGARVACAVFWFNPLVWMLARESHQLREEAADDAVLLADIDGPDYASLLVGAARHDNRAALLAAHGVAPGRGSLKRRITRVLDASLKRGPASASWIVMSLVVLAAVTAPLAAFSATAKPIATPTSATMAKFRVAVAASQSAAAAADAAESEAAQAEDAARRLSPDALIEMRAVGVTPDDIRGMRAHDRHVDADDIIAAKAVGADMTYIDAMRRSFPDADIGQMVAAYSVGVDLAYAREMRGLFPRVGIDELTTMRAVGVTADYVRAMRRSGQALPTADHAVEARVMGLNGTVRESRRSVRDRIMRVTSEGATAQIGGGAMVARSADGRVARIEWAEPPEPPAPPKALAPPGN